MHVFYIKDGQSANFKVRLPVYGVSQVVKKVGLFPDELGLLSDDVSRDFRSDYF